MVCRALGFGCEREVSTIRPQPARGHLLGEEQPEAAQAAGDDVGAVARGRREPAPAAPPRCCARVRGMSSTSLPVCSAALIARMAVAASANG